jgi:hypothetical protein
MGFWAVVEVARTRFFLLTYHSPEKLPSESEQAKVLTMLSTSQVMQSRQDARVGDVGQLERNWAIESRAGVSLEFVKTASSARGKSPPILIPRSLLVPTTNFDDGLIPASKSA